MLPRREPCTLLGDWLGLVWELRESLLALVSLSVKHSTGQAAVSPQPPLTSPPMTGGESTGTDQVRLASAYGQEAPTSLPSWGQVLGWEGLPLPARKEPDSLGQSVFEVLRPTPNLALPPTAPSICHSSDTTHLLPGLSNSLPHSQIPDFYIFQSSAQLECLPGSPPLFLEAKMTCPSYKQFVPHCPHGEFPPLLPL